MLPTIAREPDAIVMIDQRKLPVDEIYVRCRTAQEVARAIKTMVIRGAPAIGVAAAWGIALGMRNSKATGTQKFAAEFFKVCELMAGTRPTARPHGRSPCPISPPPTAWCSPRLPSARRSSPCSTGAGSGSPAP